MTELREITLRQQRRALLGLAPRSRERRARASHGGRPCVVMAHGFGGTRDTGLLGYAEGFAAAGLDVFVFDYRGFGASEGTPAPAGLLPPAARRLPSPRSRLRALCRASIRTGSCCGVRRTRAVTWCRSRSRTAAIAAVVSLTPADGRARRPRRDRARHPTPPCPAGRRTGCAMSSRGLLGGRRTTCRSSARRARSR